MFGRTIPEKANKKQKLEGQITVLQKEEKVALDSCIENFDNQRTLLLDTLKADRLKLRSTSEAQIASLRAQIQQIESKTKSKLESLDKREDSQLALLSEKQKVVYDKTTQIYMTKIIEKQNAAKKLGYELIALQSHHADLMDPYNSNIFQNPQTPQTKKKTTRKVEIDNKDNN